MSMQLTTVIFLFSQQILERKNVELEELKAHYRNKSKEQDENVAKLERKGTCGPIGISIHVVLYTDTCIISVKTICIP